MADDKKYYYLKVKDNFFDSEQMIILEAMPDGHLYSNILLKLYLRSLKNEGKLMFNDRIPYNSIILAQVVRQPVGVVEKAISIFKEFGLIEIMDNGAIYMLDIQNYIGKSSTEADRKRIYRGKIESEILLLDKCPDKCTDKPTPEIELEIELKKDPCANEDKKERDAYKKKVQEEYFNTFWELYPKKKSKQDAVKSWNKIKMTDELFDTILESLKKQSTCLDWLKNDGQYIPLAATWLNGSRWEDEIKDNSNRQEPPKAIY